MDPFTGKLAVVTGGGSGMGRELVLGELEGAFKDKAPVTAARAVTIILDGVRSGTWRILIGQVPARLDRLIRARPEVAYDYEELFTEVAVAGCTIAAARY